MDDDYVTTDDIEKQCVNPLPCKEHTTKFTRSGRELDYCRRYQTFCFKCVPWCIESAKHVERKNPQTSLIMFVPEL